MKDLLIYTRTCQECGTTMNNVGCSRRLCDACRLARIRERSARKNEYYKAVAKAKSRKPAPRSLEEEMRSARTAGFGFSYGRYMAQKEGRIK